MKKNVGSIDRIFRIVLAIIVFALGIIFQSWWGLLGLIPLFTAFFSWCPAYLPFGISTCKVKEKV
jgi:predicted RND superfamily exporter protein